jgi:hypothetical protein
MSKNKSAFAIALFLMASMTVTLISLPVANAHDPPQNITTWAYIAVANDPIGVDQTQIIVFWPNLIPPTAKGAYGDRYKWTVEITTPNGDKETLGPITSDPVGGAFTSYTPTQVGTYTAVATMADCLLTGLPLYPGGMSQQSGVAYWGDTVLGDTSEPVEFTVQEEPITAWPEAPLPTEFWTRPINNMNRDWYVLASNYLSRTASQWPLGASGGTTSPFSLGTGPETAHILWSKPAWYGGVMDARYSELGYQTSHYDGISFSPPIIINGVIYYNHYAQPKIGWHAISLYTGEELFFHNTTGPVNYALRSDSSGAILQEMLSFGQVLSYESPNEHGGRPYLWSTYGPGMPVGSPSHGGNRWRNNNETWMMFDASTGNWLLDVANVSTLGTQVYGKDGSILYYNIGTSMYGQRNLNNVQRLTVWNSTHAIEEGYGINSSMHMRNYYWCWRPFLNMTFDGTMGFSTNITLSTPVTGSIRAVRQDEFIIGGTSGSNSEADGITEGHLWCISLKRGEEGKLLWDRAFTPPKSTEPNPSEVYSAGISGPTVYVEDGVFVFSERLTRRWWGYSLDTGKLLWGPTPSEIQMHYYGMGATAYQGLLLSNGGGMSASQIYAYNMTTGELEWTYIPKQENFESPYGNYPLSISAIVDGKIYTSSSEHSPTQPLWRGSRIRCINASNGEEIWTINNWGGVAPADGLLVSYNAYDGQIYCYGKGPSATTIMASPEVSIQGSSVLIKGTVNDASPGTEQLAQDLRFPSGVPAISDDYMSAWMEYLYMQQEKPKDPEGVEVVLETLDPNGNFYEIGRTTSDATGMYSYAFTPEVPGLYTLIATFKGSGAYYGSAIETAINVEEAPQATPTAPPPEPSVADVYFVPGIIGVIIAIVAVGLIMVLMLRKR